MTTDRARSGGPSPATLRAEPEELEAFSARILESVGLAPEDARATAEGLVMANLRGVDSHGILRLIQYVASIREGAINPRPRIRVLRRTGATALLDADGGYGFRPCIEAIDLAVELATSTGVGFVGVRNSRHFGMAAIYPLRAADAGMVGFTTTTTFPLMPPPGGLRAVVGNNPVAWSVPRPPPHPPIVLDMALSHVAFGKIRLAAAEGRPIPLGWAHDARGHPTTDADEALAARLLAPVGGPKGYGLSIVSELLAGVMTQSAFGLDSDAHGGGVGHLVAAIDPAAFLDREDFYRGVEELVQQIRDVPLAEGMDAVYMPGEIETNRSEVRRREGIPVSSKLASQLEALAERVGVAPPAWR